MTKSTSSRCIMCIQSFVVRTWEIQTCSWNVLCIGCNTSGSDGRLSSTNSEDLHFYPHITYRMWKAKSPLFHKIFPRLDAGGQQKGMHQASAFSNQSDFLCIFKELPKHFYSALLAWEAYALIQSMYGQSPDTNTRWWSRLYYDSHEMLHCIIALYSLEGCARLQCIVQINLVPAEIYYIAWF
jgi:hypothetical protein